MRGDVNMNNQPDHEHGVSRPLLWYGLLGGALAWLVHLLAAYLIAEFGCLTALRDMHFLGVTAVAWLAIAVSVVTFAVAVGATVAAWMVERQLPPGRREELDPRGTELQVGWLAMLMSGLFAFIILVESVPIVYFLREC
jgi:hypothetical protein